MMNTHEEYMDAFQKLLNEEEHLKEELDEAYNYAKNHYYSIKDLRKIQQIVEAMIANYEECIRIRKEDHIHALKGDYDK